MKLSQSTKNMPLRFHCEQRGEKAHLQLPQNRFFRVEWTRNEFINIFLVYYPYNKIIISGHQIL